MKNPKTANATRQEATPIVAQGTQADKKTFDELKRDFEHALTTGEYGQELMDLSTAIAAACLNKCIDPQRTTAPGREAVSNNGGNPALLQLRRGMYHDVHLLENLRNAADKATHATHNADGDAVTETADHEALDAFGQLLGDTLSDGIDLINTAAVALLEQAADHATGEGWLDTPYTIRRLAKKVYIKDTDSAAYRDDETTPMQEAYRAVRRAIQSSRAIQTDPRNGYTYIEDMASTEDGGDAGEAIYRRCDKYADIGGVDCDGHYTADRTTVDRYAEVLEKLALTRRQAEIVRLRMRGYGYKAISSYLGIDERNVKLTVRRLRVKCTEMGFFPKELKADEQSEEADK